MYFNITYTTGSTRLLSSVLVCASVVTLALITVLLVYVIRTCSKRRYHSAVASVIRVESAESSTVTCALSPSNVTTYSAISRSTSDLLTLAAAGSLAVQGPPGGMMRQRLKSIGCLWPRLQVDSDKLAPLPVLDFDRLSAPMFARRASLQPVLVSTPSVATLITIIQLSNCFINY